MQPKARLEEASKVLYIGNMIRPAVLQLCRKARPVCISSPAISREKMVFNVLHAFYITDI
jgi:hypothetical protein